MTAVGRRWSDDELGLVMEPPAGFTLPQVARLLGRSLRSVVSMRHRLRRGWSPVAQPPLSESDLDFIRASQGMTALQVAEELGRSYGSVTHARAKLTRDEGLSFGTGPYDKNPHWAGRRTVLARTCVACGLLWGGAEFTTDRGKTSSVCRRCRAISRDDANLREAREQQVREEAERRGVPYMTHHYDEYTDADVQVLADRSLTVVEKAARLGRTYEAARQALTTFQLTSKREPRREPYGLWAIRFQETA